MGTADCADLLQIKGVLAHAGRAVAAWKFGSLEKPRRLGPGLSPPATAQP